MPRILIVEDDPSILRGVSDLLKMEGFETLESRDGVAGLRLGTHEPVDLVVLDVRLPKMDGVEVCRRLREARVAVPVLMLTAKSQEADKVVGLNAGADDYLTKPFGVAELLARVKALLRRGAPAAKGAQPPAKFGDVVLDLDRYRVTRAGRDLEVTAREFALLRYLVDHPGRVVTRDTLLQEVWGHDEPPVTRTVDSHIAQLRKKIEKDPANPRHILSVRSVGYRFER